MTPARLLSTTLLVSVLSACSGAREDASPVTGSAGPMAGRATTPTAAFDHIGRLWAAWVESSNVWISSSSDLGRTFEPAVRVTPETEPIDANSESRPKIAFTPGNGVLVSWTRKGTQPYTGDIRFADGERPGRCTTVMWSLAPDASVALDRPGATAVPRHTTARPAATRPHQPASHGRTSQRQPGRSSPAADRQGIAGRSEHLSAGRCEGEAVPGQGRDGRSRTPAHAFLDQDQDRPVTARLIPTSKPRAAMRGAFSLQANSPRHNDFHQDFAKVIARGLTASAAKGSNLSNH